MNGRPGISSIYHQANADPPQGAEATRRNRDACREAWQSYGLAVFDLNDIPDDWTRQAIENEANRLYGRRERT